MLILAGFIIHNSLVRAQCCSPGNPVGGTSSLSILAKRSIRFIGFYRYGYSDTYYQGTKPIPFHLVSSANYNYAGSIISYGVTNMFNVETELGYFLNRTQEYGLAPPYMVRGYGLSNAVVSAKYNLINNKAKNWEWTTAAGGKIPFAGQPQAVNNVELPLDVQPSTNAFGIVVQSFLYKGYVHRALHLFLLNRYEYNFANPKTYRSGSAYISSLFISKSVTPVWAGILQIRNEIRQHDYSSAEKIESSGGVILFLVPQINCNIRQKWNVSLLADMPVYKKYNGTQLAGKYALSIIIVRDLVLGNKQSE